MDGQSGPRSRRIRRAARQNDGLDSVVQRSLRRLLSLGTDIVCRLNDKPTNARHLWVFALYAKTLYDGRACRDLVDKWPSVAKTLLRIMYDSLLDMVYIQSAPRRSSEVARLLQIEVAEDEVREHEFRASACRESLDSVAKRDPRVRAVVAGWEAAKKDPLFLQRVRSVSTAERMRYLEVPQYLRQSLEYGVRVLGHTVVHSRPFALSDFIRQGSDRLPTIVAKPRRASNLMQPDWLRIELLDLLVIASNFVIETYFLGDALTDRLQAIVDNFRSVSNTQRVAGVRLRRSDRHSQR